MSVVAGRLSVVVVPMMGGAHLDRLLQALHERSGMPASGEVLVVAAQAPNLRSPAARFIEAKGGTSIPARRALGAEAASGDVIAFIEDTVEPVANWAAATLDVHARSPEAQAVGGTLSLSPGLSAKQAALAVLDYGRFLRSGPVSETSQFLTGNTMSWKRSSLERLGVFQTHSLREADLVSQLRHVPGAVRCESATGAVCVAADPKGTSVSSRFQHGRLYAGNRYPSHQRWARVSHALSAPLLSAVLLGRAATSLKRSGNLAQHRSALPHIAYMSSAWALGESVGYLLGQGEAERHWT